MQCGTSDLFFSKICGVGLEKKIVGILTGFHILECSCGGGTWWTHGAHAQIWTHRHTNCHVESQCTGNHFAGK